MTKGDPLHATADELEAMTQAELEKYFEPVLHITRPERAAKEPKKINSSGKRMSEADIAMEAARAALRQAGLDGIL